MRKKEETKKEFNLEEAFALWKQDGKNGEYLKGKTTSECGDCEIWGFYKKDKKNSKQPDITLCRKENEKMMEIAVLWESDNKSGTGKHLYGKTSENENLIAFYGDGTNNRPYIKGYFQDNN